MSTTGDKVTNDNIDINAAFELSQNAVDAARTTMQAAHKLKELAEALQQATHGGWLPASVLPLGGVSVLGLYLGQEDAELRFVKFNGEQWQYASGFYVSVPDYWCYLPKGVVS